MNSMLKFILKCANIDFNNFKIPIRNFFAASLRFEIDFGRRKVQGAPFFPNDPWHREIFGSRGRSMPQAPPKSANGSYCRFLKLLEYFTTNKEYSTANHI